MLKQIIHSLGHRYIAKVVNNDAIAQKARPVNERPVELAFLFDCIRECAPQTVLDVGTGQSALPALIRNCGCAVTAIDNIADYWPEGMINRHWKVLDADIRSPNGALHGQVFDLISCISVIEHIDRPQEAFRSMLRLLRPGGHVVMTMPYNEQRYVEDVYKLPDFTGGPMPYRCSSYSREILDGWLADTDASIIGQEYWRAWSGALWFQGERTRPTKVTSDEPHQLTCLLVQRRS